MRGLSQTLERLWFSRDRWLTAWLVALGAGALAGMAAASPWGRAFEERVGLSVLFHARGAVSPPSDVALVVMNDAAADRITLPEDTEGFQLCRDVAVDSLADHRQALPSPRTGQWPRCVHAALVRALARAGARLTVFDVSFRPRPPIHLRVGDLMQLQDAALADAMRSAGNVLLVQRVDFAAEGGTTPVCSSASPVPVSPAIRDAALGVAPFLPVAGDRIDRFSTFIACGWPTPTLPMLALQAAHPGAYATLREAVLRAHEDDAALLPVFDPDAMTRGVLEAAALQLRRLIQNRPGDTASLPPDDMAATLQRYYAEPDLHLFNHYGPPGTFEHWSYADVLARARSDPGSLRRSFQGRVVFIGYAEFTRPEQTEHFPTPFLGRESIAVSGVELLATAYSNLLRASTLRTADHAAWVAVTTAVLTTLACLLLPAFWGLALSGVGVAIHVVVAHRAFGLASLWLPVVVPVLAWISAFVVALGVQYRQVTQRHRRVQRIIEHFVPPDVARQLQMPSGLTPRSTDAIVMATDVTNYVMLAESMEAQDLRALLNRYFEVLFRCVIDNGGFVSDIVGDSMVAIWTAPAGGGLPKAAVLRACVDIQEAVESSDLGRLLPTRIGVSAGRVELGMVGALSHFEFRAVGRPVNVANRLQALNKTFGSRVLVSRELLSAQGDFRFRSLGQVLLRGRSEPLEVHELLGRAEPASADRRVLISA